MSQLRVLQVNHADIGGGGAAIAGYRLHRQLLGAGVDSTMIVGTKSADDDRVKELSHPRLIRRPLRSALWRMGLNELDGIGAYTLSRREEFQRNDVVHYHAIHGSYFSYPVMPRLTRQKPSVMTLHDMWPLTGHCSFSFDCERWRTGCGSCPYPETFPAVHRDVTSVEWRLKHRLWESSELTIVSPSEWLAEIARASMLGRFDVRVIPHGIDTSTFAPSDVQGARELLRLPHDRMLIMFSAASLADKRKGADLVLDTLLRLPPAVRRQCGVVLMGHAGSAIREALEPAGFSVSDFGYIGNDHFKALLFAASDVFVFPTRADNSPLVVLESLACGTTVVSFDVGGLNEMVRVDQTGILAPPEDTGGMADALVTLFENPDLRNKLGENGRTMAIEEFNVDLAASRHIVLYRELLAKGGSS
jgi:glycosyltransferase involved in cell wall biosynthesis